MSATPLPKGNNAPETIRRLRAIDAEIYGTLIANYIEASGGNITDLNATNITLGILVADRIDAKTITFEKLVLGSLDNLIQNPGFEDGTLDPGVVVDGSTGTWSLSSNARSGGSSARYFFSPTPMSVDARFALNGSRTTRTLHPDAAEGDEFYFTAWCRDAGPPNGTTLVKASIFFYDEGGSQLAATSSADVDVAGYEQLEVSATAPAGTAYVVFELNVDETSTATTGAVHFDDCYARRKVGTLIIEGQAVDIERMLDPATGETKNQLESSQTLDTTWRVQAEVTLTIPSWVGTAHVQATGVTSVGFQTAQSSIAIQTEIAGSGPSSAVDIFNTIPESSMNSLDPDAKTISSPGSTIACKAWAKVNAGQTPQSSNNVSQIAAMFIGLR